MKRIAILSLAVLAVLCFTNARAQKGETIEGNGRIVSKEITVKPFAALEASGIFQLKLTQGDKESVTIEADENLHALFTVRDGSNKLVIDMERLKNKNLRGNNTLRVHVVFKKLETLDLQMVGNVRSGNTLTFDDLKINNQSVGNVDLDLNVKELDLKNESVGSVTLSGRADEAVVRNNGVGSLKAGGFVVQTLDIDNSGVGSAEVNAVRGLKVRDSFLGKVKNKGAARKSNKVVI